MHKSKLIKLLKILTNDEFKLFKKYIESPYFNSNDALIQLFQHISTDYPDFTAKKLERARVIKRLYNGEALGAATTLNNHMSKLTALVEAFLAQQVYEQREEWQRFWLSEALAERASYEDYEKNVAQLSADLSQMPQPDLEHFYLLTALHQAFFYHPHTNKMVVQLPILYHIKKYLEKLYWLGKARTLLDQLHRQRTYNEVLDTAELLEAQQAIFYQPEPVFRLYSKMIQLYNEENDWALFLEAWQEMQERSGFYSLLDRQIFLHHLLHYANRHYEQGVAAYLPLMYEIIRFADEHGLLLERGTIANVSFLNVVRVACGVEEFAWAQEFMERYAVFLKGNQADVLTLAQATWHMYRGEQTVALRLSAQVTEQDFILKLQSEMLGIRIFFQFYLEDDAYYDDLERAINRFKKILQRDKTFSKERKTAFHNFGTMTFKIARCWADPDTDHGVLQKLRKEVLAKKPLSGEKWLLEMVDTLLQRTAVGVSKL